MQGAPRRERWGSRGARDGGRLRGARDGAAAARLASGGAGTRRRLVRARGRQTAGAQCGRDGGRRWSIEAVVGPSCSHAPRRRRAADHRLVAEDMAVAQHREAHLVAAGALDDDVRASRDDEEDRARDLALLDDTRAGDEGAIRERVGQSMREARAGLDVEVLQDGRADVFADLQLERPGEVLSHRIVVKEAAVGVAHLRAGRVPGDAQGGSRWAHARWAHAGTHTLARARARARGARTPTPKRERGCERERAICERERGEGGGVGGGVRRRTW